MLKAGGRDGVYELEEGSGDGCEFRQPPDWRLWGLGLCGRRDVDRQVSRLFTYARSGGSFFWSSGMDRLDRDWTDGGEGGKRGGVLLNGG